MCKETHVSRWDLLWAIIMILALLDWVIAWRVGISGQPRTLWTFLWLFSCRFLLAGYLIARPVIDSILDVQKNREPGCVMGGIRVLVWEVGLLLFSNLVLTFLAL